MKKYYFPLLFFCLLLVGCQTARLSYDQKENWLVCDSAEALSRKFDVFYIYPTLVADRENPLMDCNNQKVRKKAVGFTKAQTDIFKGEARIFAPCVRQLEYGRCLPALKSGATWDRTEMSVGIQDTCKAFDYYLKHWNQGRPFILLGHSQGAMDLYELLRKDKRIAVRKGFVAAYLAGLPMKTLEQIKQDFAGRDIHAAASADDVGVVIVWNTQGPAVTESLFAKKGVYCINPLNWRCDDTPAEASANTESSFYRFWEKDPAKQFGVFKNLCGAKIDLEKGALIVDLPVKSEYDGRGSMGAGIFHASDIWLFTDSIRNNAAHRVMKWKTR